MENQEQDFEEQLRDEALTETMLATMYNKCFKKLNRNDRPLVPFEQAQFINCFMRFLQAHQVVSDACYEGEQEIDLPAGDDE